MHVRVFLARYRRYVTCTDCRGTRLKPEGLNFRIAGRNIADVNRMSVSDAHAYFQSLALDAGRDQVAALVLHEIRRRLDYLMGVGLEYLTLDRQSRTLSGGELERVDLTTAIGSSLVNTLYVLDEPSIGLHPRDSHRLVEILHRLRSNDNTVVVVEHDPEIIKESDHVIDLGPRAGEHGGQVVFAGSYDELLASETSLTADYLTQRKVIPLPVRYRPRIPGRTLAIRGAHANNLKHIDVSIPSGPAGVRHRRFRLGQVEPGGRGHRPEHPAPQDLAAGNPDGLRRDSRHRAGARGDPGGPVSAGHHAPGRTR